MKLKLIISIFVLALTMSFTSCMSKEEKVIADLEDIQNKVSTSEDMTEAEWEELLAEYERVHKESETCNFTKEQIRECSRIEGKIVAAFCKKESKKLVKGFEDLLNNGGAMVEGFLEGVSEELNDEE